MRVYDAARYLVLFGPEKYAIYNRIIYLLSQKVVLTYIFLSYTKIKVDSQDSLPLEKNIDFVQCYNTH